MKKHRDEIIRWANSPGGTKVYAKDNSNSYWALLEYPKWIADEYIVDDEWSELRKAQADGEQLQRRMSKDSVFEDADIEENITMYVTNWRIKPKESVHEWQYTIYLNTLQRHLITDTFYLEDDALIPDGYEKFEPSKRIRK